MYETTYITLFTVVLVTEIKQIKQKCIMPLNCFLPGQQVNYDLSIGKEQLIELIMTSPRWLDLFGKHNAALCKLIV